MAKKARVSEAAASVDEAGRVQVGLNPKLHGAAPATFVFPDCADTGGDLYVNYPGTVLITESEWARIKDEKAAGGIQIAVKV
jgi:hypothetical protein